jgi:hypothetical protein
VERARPASSSSSNLAAAADGGHKMYDKLPEHSRLNFLAFYLLRRLLLLLPRLLSFIYLFLFPFSYFCVSFTRRQPSLLLILRRARRNAAKLIPFREFYVASRESSRLSFSTKRADIVCFPRATSSPDQYYLSKQFPLIDLGKDITRRATDSNRTLKVDSFNEPRLSISKVTLALSLLSGAGAGAGGRAVAIRRNEGTLRKEIKREGAARRIR